MLGSPGSFCAGLSQAEQSPPAGSLALHGRRGSRTGRLRQSASGLLWPTWGLGRPPPGRGVDWQPRPAWAGTGQAQLRRPALGTQAPQQGSGATSPSVQMRLWLEVPSEPLSCHGSGGTWGLEGRGSLGQCCPEQGPPPGLWYRGRTCSGNPEACGAPQAGGGGNQRHPLPRCGAEGRPARGLALPGRRCVAGRV